MASIFDDLLAPPKPQAQAAPKAALPKQAPVVTPKKALPLKKGGSIFDDMLAPPAPVQTPPPAPVVQAPAPKVYGPPKPTGLPPNPANFKSLYQPDLSFGSSNSTLQIPTQEQQAVVNKAVDTVDKYQQGKGAGPAALRTVTGTLGAVDEAMLATAQKVDPVTGQKKTKTRQAIDYTRAGVKAVGLFPPFLAFSAGSQAAENIDIEGGPKSIWDTPAYLNKAAVKGLATGVNKAFETVTKAGGYGVKSTQEGVFDIYNTATRGGIMRDRTNDVQPSPEALALGEELGGFAALLLAGKVAAEGVSAVKSYKGRTMGVNDVVRSAKDVLAVEKSKTVLGNEKRVAPEVIKKNYRDAAHETHPDRGGSAQEFQVVKQAATILEDYNTLSNKDFYAKYKAPLAQVNKIIKQIPEKSGQPPQAPKPVEPAPQGVQAPVAGQNLATAPVGAPVAAKPNIVLPQGAKIVTLDVRPTPAELTQLKEAGFTGMQIPDLPAPVMFDVAPQPVAPVAVESAPVAARPQPQTPTTPVPEISPAIVPTIPTPAQPEPIVQPQEIAPVAPKNVLESVNPTGTVFTEYNPQSRATAELGKNITTLDKTMGVAPDEMVTIYRGAPSTQSQIVSGDFVTTNKQLAKDYAGNGKVLEQTVKASDVLDSLDESLGEEYVYRPVGKPKTEIVAQTPKAKPTVTLPAPKEKPLEVFKLEPIEIHDRIMTELLFAERGRRIGVRNEGSSGMTFSTQKSTFPQWVPKELRRKPLFDAVVKHLSDGTLPTKAAEKRLYRAVVEEINAQMGVINDKKFVQETRQNLIDPYATEAENAAALAKFDAEYAKLKSNKSSSAQKSEAPVPAVGKSVPAKAEVVSSPTKEVAPKKSKVGASIEAKTLEKGFAEAFSDTAGYTPITIKEQAQKVADLMNTDFETARDIINGKADLPDGMFAEALIKGMEDYALETGNAELALEIANSALTSETSRHAQALRLLAERNPDSAVAVIQQLKKIKEAVVKEKRGKTKEKVVEEIKETVKKTKPRHTKERWADFITEITCK